MQTNIDCTYKKTGSKHQLQVWATCYDCFANKNEGACQYCLKNCHKNHNIGELQYSSFFCDCGHQNKCIKSTSTDVSIPPQLSVTTNTLARKLFHVFENDSVYSPLSINYILSLLHIGSSA